MRRALAILLAFVPLVALAGDPAKPVDLTMVWSVSLDDTGAITALKPAEEANAALYQRLEPAIRTWHFTPGKVDGRAAPAQTTLTVHLTMEPVEGGYRPRLRRAETGVRYGTISEPKYPDGAVMSHRGGAVLLSVHYDAAGHVTDAVPLEGGNPHPGSDIVRAAIVAVKHWTFTPETIAGHGLAGAAKVPICFNSPPARENCRWTDPATNTPIEADHPLTEGSIVSLQGDVADHVL
jgi:TonB family protein